MNRRTITLTTDFGTDDHYVGTMKGVVLKINPEVNIVDLCHAVASFDLLDGALTLASAYSYFPDETIHVVVVDPGVGSERRAIVALAGKHIFVAPDNGVLTLVYRRESSVTVRHITNDRYFLHPVSNTFHGRDIFAPVAAHLSSGVPVEAVGREITDYARIDVPQPQVVGGFASGAGAPIVQGIVLKTDKFGNVVTNIGPDDLVATIGPGAPFRLSIGDEEIAKVSPTYAAAPQDELFAVFGSMGLLEVALNQGSAAERLRARRGDPVRIIAVAPKN
jgi:S-adenosylmethionine hydrolase